VKTYEKRVNGAVVERVANVKPGSWRDEELAGWVSVRKQMQLEDGWHLAGDDGDDGEAGGPGPLDQPVAVADVLNAAVSAADQRSRRTRAREDDKAPPAEAAAAKE
jgi:hypothetical protein